MYRDYMYCLIDLDPLADAGQVLLCYAREVMFRCYSCMFELHKTTVIFRHGISNNWHVCKGNVMFLKPAIVFFKHKPVFLHTWDYISVCHFNTCPRYCTCCAFWNVWNIQTCGSEELFSSSFDHGVPVETVLATRAIWLPLESGCRPESSLTNSLIACPLFK